MTWADVAAKNAPPPSEQPKPDPSLLEGEHHDSTDLSHSGAHDEKVNIVTRDEFEHDLGSADAPVNPAPGAAARAASANPNVAITEPTKLSAEDAPATTPASRNLPTAQSGGHGHQVSKDVEAAKEDAKKEAAQAEAAAAKKVEQGKQAAAQAAGEAKEAAKEGAEVASQKAGEAKEAAKDGAAVASQKAKEGADVASQKLSEGKKEAEKKLAQGKEAAEQEYNELSAKAKASYDKLSKEAREDWHKLSKESKKQWEAAKNSEVGQELQKPEVWGSMLTVANLAVIGSLAYFTYSNWGKPRWDRRIVSATAIGVSTWFGLQGYLLPQTEAVQNQRRRRLD